MWPAFAHAGTVSYTIRDRTGDALYRATRATDVRAAVAAALRVGLDLRGADLRGADLTGADLQDADLGDADLRDADLRGTNLWYANLGGADLQGALLGMGWGPHGNEHGAVWRARKAVSEATLACLHASVGGAPDEIADALVGAMIAAQRVENVTVAWFAGKVFCEDCQKAVGRSYAARHAKRHHPVDELPTA